MRYSGDYDDAVSVLETWLQMNPGRPVWERDDYEEPVEELMLGGSDSGPRFSGDYDTPSRHGSRYE